MFDTNKIIDRVSLCIRQEYGINKCVGCDKNVNTNIEHIKLAWKCINIDMERIIPCCDDCKPYVNDIIDNELN